MAETAASSSDARFKIGDVCRIADVQPYVLRYWESEFPVLAPDKSMPGPRTYSARELKLIEQIKRLLYDEGYTIAGAKKRLEGEAAGKAGAKDTSADTNPAVTLPAEAKAAKAAKAEKSEKADKPEKVAEPEKQVRVDKPRAAKPSAPAFLDASIELAAPEITKPVAQGPADDRVARAVADLKEVLALLSRSEP